MRLTNYGHSCFTIEIEKVSKVLLFDPFITGNELAKQIDPASIEADYILLSHGHIDHTGDVVAIAKRTGATVIANWEICQWLKKQGIDKSHPMNTGGHFQFEGFNVKSVVAQHSSSMPDGSYGGNPVGFIVYSGDECFYYSGDTALTMDMQLIPKWAKLNFAVLPIGDNFTMGYEDAVMAARMVECDKVVGVHYDTFGLIRIDHEKAKKAFAGINCTLCLPAIGETISIS